MPVPRRQLINTEALLSSQPRVPSRTGPPGLRRLEVHEGRTALLSVPHTALAHSAALVVLMHGAGGTAQQGLELLVDEADGRPVILLAPQAAGKSWDLITQGRFGEDVEFLDECLAQIFDEYPVAEEQVAIGGFSDGASYALSVGLTNGQLFRSILAFSPGFAAPARFEEQPRVFLSHGTEDRVLPIEPCGRTVKRLLDSRDIAVHFHEFQGGHTVPRAIREAALEFMLQAGGTPAQKRPISDLHL